MTRLETHLQHLLKLLAPPFTDNWKAHCWYRAKELAKDPELEDLPRLLEEAMQSQPKEPAQPPAPTC